MGYNDNNALVKGFYQSNGKTLLPDLFDKKAEEIANCFGEKKPKIDKKTGKQFCDKFGNLEFNEFGVSSTQMRRFFDEVKRYDRLLNMQGQSWEKQEAYIRMLKSKVSYSVARVKDKDVNKKYYKNLAIFINSGIDCVKSAEDYHVFTSLFEAVYGFYYELAPDRNK